MSDTRSSIRSAASCVTVRRASAVVLGLLGAGALAASIAAAPEEGRTNLVQVSATELIDLSKVSRVSRTATPDGKPVVTFYFSDDGERANFAVVGADAEGAWNFVLASSKNTTGVSK